MALALYSVAINALTYFLYWWDKRAAIRREWRVSEAVLLFAGFAGGTPAAIVAQQYLRHKTRKLRFLLPFYLVTAIQLGILLIAPEFYLIPIQRLLG